MIFVKGSGTHWREWKKQRSDRIISADAMEGILKILLLVYRKLISPLISGLGGRCRFYPSCSEYAEAALDEFGLWGAIKPVVMRILRCSPWSEGGVDPVPSADQPAIGGESG